MDWAIKISLNVANGRRQWYAQVWDFKFYASHACFQLPQGKNEVRSWNWIQEHIYCFKHSRLRLKINLLFTSLLSQKFSFYWNETSLERRQQVTHLAKQIMRQERLEINYEPWKEICTFKILFLKLVRMCFLMYVGSQYLELWLLGLWTTV